MKAPSYLSIETRIAAAERGGIRERWTWGRQLLVDPNAFNPKSTQLKPGYTADLVQAAEAAGLRLSVREVSRRLQFARIYTTEQAVDEIIAKFGSWHEMADADFPPLLDDLELDDLALVDEQPDEFRRKAGNLPGFKATLRLHGEEIDLADATVGDLVAYRDKYRSMHEGFGKILDLIEATVSAVLEGAGGDLDANAIEAYEHGAGLDEGGAE